MYIPKINQVTDHNEIFEFIRANSFGILVNQLDGLPFATHIPMEINELPNGKWMLQCHIAKANPHWKAFEKNPKSLIIFSGPHAYISPSWYKNESVPTWNYMAVHLYGNAKIITEEELKITLKNQIDTYESYKENPVSLTDYSEENISRMINAVVGIEILVDDIQAKYKLSQNKSEQDFQNVIRHLEKSKNSMDNKVADEMKKLKK